MLSGCECRENPGERGSYHPETKYVKFCAFLEGSSSIFQRRKVKKEINGRKMFVNQRDTKCQRTVIVRLV